MSSRPVLVAPLTHRWFRYCLLAVVAWGMMAGGRMTLFGKEYIDPLSAVRFDIPDEIKVETKDQQLHGKPMHITAAVYPYQDTAILALYTSYLWGPVPKEEIRKSVEVEGKPDPSRPNRHITKTAWKKIGSRDYFVIESYDELPAQNIYAILYLYGSETYQFGISFSTNRKIDDAIKAIHERILSEVRFPK